MKLYLIRHAEAAPGEDDAARPLTDAGRAAARSLGEVLRDKGVRLDAVVSSPLVRAVQTADEVLAGFAGTPARHECDDLAFGGKRKRLTRFVGKLGVESVALVGHMPDLASYTAWLLGGKNARIDIAKPGVACLEFDEFGKGGGTLQWLVDGTWLPPAPPVPEDESLTVGGAI